ncbi:SET domain-containing protein [Hyaloscypha variabilis F]|uniref:SET domain-containing protein n=1 Tax=Hyaloscypha variabilis (strain UAMH 11265 / GT02V1 / F) TaxID=1149755 RepID=A0A2J6QRE6_HYAVF|nr:SET domain-containing protein [Hyaloscypha variabilis F]
MSQAVQHLDSFARVKATVPLEIRQSSIPVAGRGMFATELISAQNLIFSIAKPLLCIVDDGAEALRNICDNCFATRKGIYQTIRERRLTYDFPDGILNKPSNLKSWTFLSILRIINSSDPPEACRIEAWEHHHRVECTVLSQMHHDLRGVENKVPARSMRALIRLMCLYDAGMIPAAEWEEFMSLKVTSGIGREKLAGHVEYLAEIVDYYKVTKLEKSVVKQLAYAHFNNNLVMDQPLLRNSFSYPSGNGCVTSGVCLEPFASMINHSCQPNSWWTFNGSEFQLRAVRDIPTGEELSISYIGITASYRSRQENIIKDWGFECSCLLCKEGPQEPMEGPLHENLLEIQKLERSTPVGSPLQMNQDFIDEMLLSGYHLGNYPIPYLYRQIYTATLRKGDNIEGLKVYLKIYFEIEHVVIPPPFPDDRINSLKKVISLIRTAELVESLLITEEIKSLLPYIRGFLSKKLCRETEKCFGPDTEIAKFEREQHQKMFGQSTNAYDDRERYVNDINKVLGWAGLTNIPEMNL